MQLLIERGQKDSQIGLVQRPVFQLWAKFELTEEERELINKYKVVDSVLYLGNVPKDIFRSARWGIFGGFVLAWLAYAYIPRLPFFTASFIMVVSSFLLSYIIYENIREMVIIKDVINGRFFTCKSVTLLIEKEQTMTEMACMFREFLEALKTWGGKQIVHIKPGMVPTLRLIEQNREAA